MSGFTKKIKVGTMAFALAAIAALGTAAPASAATSERETPRPVVHYFPRNECLEIFQQVAWGTGIYEWYLSADDGGCYAGY